MWGGNASSIDILVRASSVEKVEQKLTDNKIKYELIIEDLQKAIDEENPPSSDDEETNDRQGEQTN